MKTFLPLLLVGCAIFGCSSADTAASTSSATTAQSEQRKCAACATSVAASDAVEKDGKTYCKACAEAH